MELLIVSIIFYVLGSIIEAASKNLEGFSAGAVFYELGYTMAQLLSESTFLDPTYPLANAGLGLSSICLF
jgi:SIT family siderophore-iron:H+ symporter-like MFS transporter